VKEKGNLRKNHASAGRKYTYRIAFTGTNATFGPNFSFGHSNKNWLEELYGSKCIFTNSLCGFQQSGVDLF